jgi:hypothetical protein
MTVDLQDLLSLYVFSTGRRLFALKQAHKVAKKMKLTDIDAHITAAIKHDKKTRALELTWAGQAAGSPEKSEAPRIDALVDRTLTALRDAAQAQAEGADAGDAIVKVVDAFLLELFPGGVQAITQMTYVDELSATEAVLEKLKGKLAPQVTELGLGRLVARLQKLVASYQAALEGP